MMTHQPIRLRDIAALAHLSGENFGAAIREDRIALRGRRSQQAVPAGHVVHTTDAAAETGFETRVMRPPGFVLHMVLGPIPELDAIAGAGRMSLSSARRLFQRAHGTPIRARIRDLRLLAAYEGLRRRGAIAGAAHGAGYVSPESFATAFGRRFGTSPSQLRQP